MNREEKRARDLRYDATEKGQANRQRKVAAFHERYDSDPAYRERRLPAARLWLEQSGQGLHKQPEQRRERSQQALADIGMISELLAAYGFN